MSQSADGDRQTNVRSAAALLASSASRPHFADRAGVPTLERVRAHFQKPELYLQNRVDISARCQLVEELIGRPAEKSILDVGCGDGSISLPLLAGSNRLTLIDLSQNMLEIAEQGIPAEWADRVTFLNADFVDHEWTEQFDIVLCIGVLAHVTRIEDAIARLACLVKPGGECIIQLTDAGRFAGRMLHGFGVWYGRLVRGHGYSTNCTKADETVALARQQGLFLAGKRGYWPLLPGMKRLPAAWTSRFQRFGRTNRYFSRHGADVLLHFKKVASENGRTDRTETEQIANVPDARSSHAATDSGSTPVVHRQRGPR